MNSDFADVNKKFDTEFEEMEEAMDKAKEAQIHGDCCAASKLHPSSAGRNLMRLRLR